MMRIIRGYDNKESTQNYIVKHSKECLVSHIFNNTRMAKPTYDQTNSYNSIMKPFRFEEEAILVDIRTWLVGISNQEMLASTITTILKEYALKGVNNSIIKNTYIRMMIDIKYVFMELMNKSGKLLYIGTPDKYEIIILTVLGLYGVDVLIVDLGGDKLYSNFEKRYEIAQGSNYEAIDIYKKDTPDVAKSANEVNTWVNIDRQRTIKDYFDLINSDIEHRKTDNKYKTLNIEFTGIHDITEYSQLINDVLTRASALKRNNVLIDSGVPNPTYDESMIKDVNTDTEKRLKELGLNYEQLHAYIEELVNSKNLSQGASDNYRKVMNSWLNRYIKKLYTEIPLRVPLIMVWGQLKEREDELIGLLSLIPIDIIHFITHEDFKYSIQIDNVRTIQLGNNSNEPKEFPKVTTVTASTVAYKAERELDTLLYSGNEGIYRSMQFRNIQPVTLKTTYDEIGILWGHEAKFRPAFETTGNLVKAGTIFTKINGVDNRGKEEYYRGINNLITKDTTVYDKLPFTDQNKSEKISELVKQVIFKDKVDFEKIKSSKQYKYGIYSDETQNLIFSKIEQLIELDWCSTDTKNISYLILETLLQLQPEIVAKIHGYDFTGKPPKILIFSGNTDVCSLEDCIVIMFLKLIGFDIVVYAPTGYRIIEQYIKAEHFNTIELGDYDFEMIKIEDTPKTIENKAKNVFGRLFGLS